MRWTYSARRVAAPRQRTRTPVASGSRVPVWPSRVPRGNQRCARSTAAREVSPGGLSRTRRPRQSDDAMRFSAGRDCGGMPVCASIPGGHPGENVAEGVIPDGRREAYFVNGLGLGFNSAVTLESRRIPRLRGLARYGLAFLQAVAWHYHSPPLSIAFDDEPVKERRTLAFTVNLGKREGGFLLTPQARLDDGLFDYIHAGPISRL